MLSDYQRIKKAKSRAKEMLEALEAGTHFSVNYSSKSAKSTFPNEPCRYNNASRTHS